MPIKNTRVLIVDDSETICGLLQRVFEWEEVYSETAETLEDGLKRAQRAAAQGAAFDVILLDLHMPDNSPAWFVGNLRDTLGSVTPKILIFSASMSAVAEAVRLQAHGCIQKPFYLDELFAEIDRVVRPKHEAPPLPVLWAESSLPPLQAGAATSSLSAF